MWALRASDTNFDDRCISYRTMEKSEMRAACCYTPRRTSTSVRSVQPIVVRFVRRCLHFQSSRNLLAR